jgi:hypothetical protein
MASWGDEVWNFANVENETYQTAFALSNLNNLVSAAERNASVANNG